MLLRKAGPLSSHLPGAPRAFFQKPSLFPHLSRWMGIFPFGNLHPTIGKEAPQEKGTPATPSPGPPCTAPTEALRADTGPPRGGTGQSEEVWPSAVSVRSLGGAAAAPLLPGCRGLGLWGWRRRLVAMEWVSESATVRRHRVGGERRDGPAAAPQPEREARAPETLVDARGGGGGGARTRKRSGAGGGGASGAARTGLSEARAALGLALYLLALRTLVQLSLQQLVLHGSPGHPREFNARQARYRPRRPARARPFPRVPCRSPGAAPGAPTPAGPPGLAGATCLRVGCGGWGALARLCPGDPISRTRGWLAWPPAELVV